jgi:hypothetical protein
MTDLALTAVLSLVYVVLLGWQISREVGRH